MMLGFRLDMVDLLRSKGVKIGMMVVVIAAVGILSVALAKFLPYPTTAPRTTYSTTASERTVTPPSKTPAPWPGLVTAWFDINASCGFDKILYGSHFVLSRGKSGTVVMTVTSQSDRILSISVRAESLPVGVTVEFDRQTFSLNPNEKVALKMTLTVSSTAPTTTPKLVSTTTSEATSVETPTPLLPPPASLPASHVTIEFSSEGSIIESTGFYLTTI